MLVLDGLQNQGRAEIFGEHIVDTSELGQLRFDTFHIDIVLWERQEDGREPGLFNGHSLDDGALLVISSSKVSDHGHEFDEAYFCVRELTHHFAWVDEVWPRFQEANDAIRHAGQVAQQADRY